MHYQQDATSILSTSQQGTLTQSTSHDCQMDTLCPKNEMINAAVMEGHPLYYIFPTSQQGTLSQSTRNDCQIDILCTKNHMIHATGMEGYLSAQ